jgi:SAM-dependent methyltransferase
VAVLAMISLSAHSIAGRYNWLESDRSFFGVMRIAHYQEPLMGGEVRMLLHGTTLHGAQAVSPTFRCHPTLYYAPTTPIGQAAQQRQTRGDVVFGVIGQGTGAMAAYKRAGDTLDFFEIDPLVDRMSRDPSRFSFISACADGPVRTVIGDARLTLNREPAGKYDMLLVDAFSSDAIPTHLLTQEAIAGYLRAVKPDGVVVLHLSNRNLDITRPAFAAATALGAPNLHQIYYEQDDQAAMAEASTEALILSPTEAGLAAFRADRRWNTLAPTTVKPWTDDYINLFGALTRSIQADWESQARKRARARTESRPAASPAA